MGVTLIQIAREAGVSITTVSRVLNGTAGEIRISDDTQRRVRDAAERLDYKPNILARGLRSGRSSLIGLILGDAGSLAGILEGVERSATARGYGLLARRRSPRPSISWRNRSTG
jgi:LacI family transcriptional regulator